MSIQSASQPPTTPPYNSASARPSLTWSPKSDLTLTTARSKGLNWQSIATKHFPNKTANACRKRHERLMERRNAESWDEARLEQLAARYMEYRKEMWSGLADKLGEKWQVVEAKVIETGVRNLTAAARNATRRGEGTDEIDSGIGSSEAESSLGPEEVDSTMAESETRSDPGTEYTQPPAQVLPPLQSARRFTRHGPTIASLLLPTSPAI